MTTSNLDPLTQAVRAFLIDRQARGLSSRTVDFYRDGLHLFCDRLPVADPLQITPHHIREYLLSLAGHCNPGGVHAAYRCIRAFLRWYGDEYEPHDWHNPIQKVRPPKVTAEPLPPVSLVTVKALLATCDKSFHGQRDRAIIMALLDTGCRASEFVALNVDDLDISTGAIIIRRGKGGKRRLVFLGAKTRRELTRYLRLRPEAGPLWTTARGGRLTFYGLRQVMRRRATLADIAVPGLHSFRRAFALTMKRGGVDLVDLQVLMGHADLAVLRRYLATDDTDLAAAHRRAGPVDRLL